MMRLDELSYWARASSDYLTVEAPTVNGEVLPTRTLTERL
jgi:hypothetical protein